MAATIEKWILLMPRRTFRCSINSENKLALTCSQFIFKLEDYMDGTGHGSTLEEASKEAIAAFQATIWKGIKNRTGKDSKNVIPELKEIMNADHKRFYWLDTDEFKQKVFKDKALSI